MIYQYNCPKCKNVVDIVKDADDYIRIEICSICASELLRVYSSPFLKITKTTWPEFNPAFGKVMDKKEVDYEVKKRGLIEVGNEDLNKFEQQQESINVAKRSAEWDNLVSEAYGET